MTVFQIIIIYFFFCSSADQFLGLIFGVSSLYKGINNQNDQTRTSSLSAAWMSKMER